MYGENHASHILGEHLGGIIIGVRSQGEPKWEGRKGGIFFGKKGFFFGKKGFFWERRDFFLGAHDLDVFARLSLKAPRMMRLMRSCDI